MVVLVVLVVAMVMVRSPTFILLLLLLVVVVLFVDGPGGRSNGHDIAEGGVDVKVICLLFL